MSRTATLKFGDQTIELPVVEGSEGELAIDISQLRAKTGLITLDPGFGNTGACESDITFIDGEKGILRYRGIPIEQLAERSSFSETAWLLIYGQLPKRDRARAVQRDRSRRTRRCTRRSSHHFEGFPVNAPPMAMLSAMINTLSCFHPQLHEDDDEEFYEEAARLISKVRTIAAYTYRRSLGLPFIYPDPKLPLRGQLPAHDVLDALRAARRVARGRPGPEPDPDAPRRPRAELQHLDGADRRLEPGEPVRLVRRGRLRLWGPLHGGANVAVLEMLEEIHKGGMTAEQALALAKDKSSDFKLMGFGHRVYKNFDPRAVILKRAADKVLAQLGVKDPLLDIARKLEELALKRLLLRRPQALPQRRLLQRHPDAGDGHPDQHVHRHLRHRPDARLDRPLEGAARRPRRPDRPPPPGLHRADGDELRADRTAVKLSSGRSPRARAIAYRRLPGGTC